MKVLVIGGTRFMGLATVSRLIEHDHEVAIFNRGTRQNPWPGRVRQILGDRTNQNSLAQLKAQPFDGIVDFAAYTAEHVRLLLEVQGDVPRLVHISSGTVYGLEPRLPWPEDTPYGPAALWGEYAQGKIECERTLRAARSDWNATIVVRLPWVLGPHNYADREAFVLNRVLDQAEILLPGDGKALQQFVSSQQVAEAVVAVLEAASDGGWRAFNIATPGYLSLEGFVRICAAAAEVQPIFRSIGNGPTGTDSMVFDMNDCVFPFPNENYLLDLTASNEAHVAPTPITVDSIVEASLVALRADSGLRKWYRTAAERAHLQQAASQP